MREFNTLGPVYPFTVPYFTPAEVTDLLTQHSAETGQIIEPDVIEAAIHETEGQPYLVNRLGQRLTEDLVPHRSQPSAPLRLPRRGDRGITHVRRFASDPRRLWDRVRTDC